MPTFSSTFYIEPNTIEQITVGTSHVDINISRSSVSGSYGIFTTTSIGWDGESSKQITISADGYNDYTGSLLFDDSYMKWKDLYATLTESAPNYVSKLSNGTNTYVIKDANAVKSVNNVQPVDGNVSLTIPTVNNPTITITQGGVTKGSFTLNQSSEDTIALDAGGGGWTPPSQTGNAGKFLTTDGSDTSWGTALVNNATGTSSFSLVNPASYNYSYFISSGSSNSNYSTAFGYNASAAGGGSCVFGASSSSNSTSGVMIGYSVEGRAKYSVAVGAYSKAGSSTSYSYSTALGAYAQANGANCIQIGKGTNTTTDSFFVGSVYGSGTNYQLMDLKTGNIPIARLGATSGDTDKFLKGDGTWATVSGGSSYAPNLFDSKWSDYELNDQSWLRADTFSWQDGTVYSDAYNHLVADYNGGTSQTETVGSHTITYILSIDGHKITTDEATVQNIYNESGIAWYYILDTTNQRFKLPHTKYGFTGLRDSVGGYVPESLPNIKGETNRFNLSQLGDSGAEDSALYTTSSSGRGSATNDIQVPILHLDASRSSSTYQDNAPVQQRATQMYLYFYVGQFSQTAIEQTAGLNTELFNGKVDLDAANLSTEGKSLISGLGMPSSRYTDLTLGASGATYTAPANGWFYFAKLASASNQYMTMYVDNGGTPIFATTNTQPINGGQARCFLPVKKGDVVGVSYNLGGTTNRFCFVYAEGEQ